MSSRILQEDSDLLLTESGDSVINDNFIGASGFVTGNPTLATTSIIQVHNILCDSITTSNPVVSDANLDEEETFTAVNIVTGSPTLATASINQVHVILGNNILTGNPVVPAANMDEEETFEADSFVTGNPVVNSSAIRQTQIFLTTNITLGVPSVETTTILQDHIISGNSIVTSAPTLEDTSFNQNQNLSANSITTGIPILTTAFYNAALRRIVDISSTNKTSATLDEIEGNTATITELSNVINFSGSSNSSVVPATNNSATLSNPINEVA